MTVSMRDWFLVQELLFEGGFLIGLQKLCQSGVWRSFSWDNGQ